MMVGYAPAVYHVSWKMHGYSGIKMLYWLVAFYPSEKYESQLG